MLAPLFLCLALAQNSDAQTAPAEGSPQPTAPSGTVRRPASRSEAAWTLDYQAGPLRLYLDASTGESYWYATFTIVNRSGKDRHIAPRWNFSTSRAASASRVAAFPATSARPSCAC